MIVEIKQFIRMTWFITETEIMWTGSDKRFVSRTKEVFKTQFRYLAQGLGI